MKDHRSPAQKAAITGILAAMTLTAAFAERALCALLPLPPGVRPGLSNIVIMFTCAAMGFPYAVCVSVIKSAFTAVASGAYSGIISLCGGLLSVSVTALLIKRAKKLSYAGISVISAVAHNAGQLSAVSLLTGSASYFYLAPVLLVSGVVFGIVTGTVLNAVMPALIKILPFIKKGR